MKKIMIVLFVVLLASCKPAQLISNATDQKENIKQQYETIYNLVVKDSVHITDSVVIHPDGSINKMHKEASIKYVDKDTYIRIYYNIDHSLTITKTIAVQVEKDLSVWQKFLIWAGKIMLFIFFGALVYIIIRYFPNIVKITSKFL